LKRVRELRPKFENHEEHARYLSYLEAFLVNQRNKYSLSATYYEPKVHTL